MAGCNRLQVFVMVRWGAATRQILMGINQTIMATLSMVIFAAVIGGFEDIGWEVLRAARKAEFGNGILAGIVVTLIAILLDRTSEVAFVRRERHVAGVPSPIYWAAAILLSIATAFLVSRLTFRFAEALLPKSIKPSLRSVYFSRARQMD
jgi:glycine betaine/proline transport system permease protein